MKDTMHGKTTEPAYLARNLTESYDAAILSKTVEELKLEHTVDLEEQNTHVRTHDAKDMQRSKSNDESKAAQLNAENDDMLVIRFSTSLSRQMHLSMDHCNANIHSRISTTKRPMTFTIPHYPNKDRHVNAPLTLYNEGKNKYIKEQ